ncbi:MAG: peptide deformylase [Acidimicrobiaceae bacterium]|nr:peptide deformylase [Acidimicrobiaceae bacterium]
MSTYDIRIIGDPALRQKADEVVDMDVTVAHMAERMVQTMHKAGGIGLAGPQVGVLRRLFAWDLGDGPHVIVNPVITENDGEWTFTEGCLSVPGLSCDITRPKQIHMVGLDLDGNELSIEADELAARLFQHEIDHLDGILLIDHLDEEMRKETLKVLRKTGFMSVPQNRLRPSVVKELFAIAAKADPEAMKSFLEQSTTGSVLQNPFSENKEQLRLP